MRDFDDAFDTTNDVHLKQIKFNSTFESMDNTEFLLLLGSFMRNDGFLNLTLLRRINFDLPVLPVMLPCFCGTIDTRNTHTHTHTE
jgi:hypothetical protein